jgi:flagellar biogenesis protein FliO
MGKIFLILIAIILFITFFITFIKGVFRRFFIRIINTSQQKQTISDTVLFKNDKITVLDAKKNSRK